ncbi:hypothetical protein SLEP1_g38629 [Rubroshorea leprosula]|uniref:PGG domain-containing protein n=1 Tax=Rubroshorea leprosula TaxID=152421 RepID=A0AAV5KYE2_9ROSI|nr:hypothetical protein SLEP1_g38629 [Rubroshorea leprosula]
MTTSSMKEEIFSLIYGLDAKDALVTFADKDNNMLHPTGKLAPNSQLSRISGAALQMQRELQWFKEVENIVPHMCKGDLNRDGETPQQVFTRNHKKLVRDGGEWMKQTANSSTIVGALIITIMFAAAFTVPGGNNQHTGFPIFLDTKSFMIFIISDAISLFAASTSVLMFLGILTTRYAEKDFLKSLPTKLIIGLSTLFLSIAAMMVAFCAALLIMLVGQRWLVIPIVLVASIPVTLFAWLQSPLLVEIFISTYGSGIFKRKMKRWL